MCCFTHRIVLKSLYPRLISHGLHCFGAKQVMGFFGRKLTGHFQGELITDMLDLWHERIPGVRIKHRVEENWIKVSEKAGRVLRIETVIHNPKDIPPPRACLWVFVSRMSNDA